MNIFFLSNNSGAGQDLQNYLALKTGNLRVENDITRACEEIRHSHYDIIIIEPSQDLDSQQIRRHITTHASVNNYIILLSETYCREEAQNAGMNDVLGKPIDYNELHDKLENARFMGKLCAHLTDESEDFPNAGGVISKSAFKQLFLSAIDRTGRYNENACIIMIGLENFREILENDGPYAAEYAAARLSQNLVRLRRQADIIGQTGKHEYALLLFGSENRKEPISAANRFATSLSQCSDIYEGGARQAHIYVQAIFLPAGICVRDHRFEVVKEADSQQDW